MAVASSRTVAVYVGHAAQFTRDAERTVTRIGELEILTLAVDGVIFAVGNRCTHQPIQLRRGPINAARCEIICPVHRGAYSLLTGAATEPPCELPLPVYEVLVRAEDVFVLVPADPAQAPESHRVLPPGARKARAAPAGHQQLS